MKALVVFESMFGNTEKVARAVAEGLAESMAVDVLPVTTAPAELAPDVALVVAGGPTHAFSMSRSATRADAVRQGATAASETGLREWLHALPRAGRGRRMATFGTRADKVRHLPGSAAKSAAKAARELGFQLVARPMSFYVGDVAGPLLPGELDRARAWGRELGAATAHESAGTAPLGA